MIVLMELDMNNGRKVLFNVCDIRNFEIMEPLVPYGAVLLKI